MEMQIAQVANGVWKVTLGEPEALTPLSVLKPAAGGGLEALPAAGRFPLDADRISFHAAARGCVVTLPFDSREHVYGFGLQLKKLDQTGRKKHLRVNSDPVYDTGDSHAPVPFYVSTSGYGVYTDTARYATFYCGTSAPKGAGADAAAQRRENIADNTADLYAPGEVPEHAGMRIEIPAARGVTLYVFEGPDMRSAVSRYNLFSGGGCLPPLWGLGVWYRVYGGCDEAHALELADDLRRSGIPCDVLGLEPGWHSHSYSCSYKWDTVRFPEPEKLLDGLESRHYKVNLWEHAFVHPSADFYGALAPCAGDCEVWGGLVPDFADGRAEEIFGAYHREKFIDKGISGFKLDECDNSDYNITNWSFPEGAEFPSGLDGEQMHSLFGLLYQRTLYRQFRRAGKRTLSQVRSSHALAAPFPFVLYSDLYGHRDFIRGVANMGFSGLLWSPEVRGCASAEDLIRRLQSVVFSPQALINAWMIPNPPWVELSFEQAPQGAPLRDCEQVQAVCRRILELRMSLIPYLYTSFAAYRATGLPPFRALVLDYPEDAACHACDDEYLMGDSLLVAPLTAGESSRYVYLPQGEWFDFYTGERYEGGARYNVMPPLDRIPVFAKGGTAIPWADPVPYIDGDTVFDITARIYGAAHSFTLYEDDGMSFGFERGDFNLLTGAIGPDGALEVCRRGSYGGTRYRVHGTERIG